MTIETIPAPAEGPVLRGDVLGGRLCDLLLEANVDRTDPADLMDWWVRDAAVRVLAEGERCPCIERGKAEGYPITVTKGCPDCHGAGYTRAPIHLGAITDAERRGRITAEVAAWLLWVNVLRLDSGLNYVSLPGEWAPSPNVRDGFWRRKDMGLDVWCDNDGWLVSGVARGDETWVPGQEAADLAAVSAGMYACDNGDHLLLPHPDGVMRVDLTEAP